MNSEDSVDILGIDISRADKNQVRAKIECALTTNTPLTIFTPNPEIIIEAQRDENFRSILNSADLLIPDGIGVIIASRLLRDPLPERITGIDTGEFILNLAAKYAIPIFLLGAKAGVAERAANELGARYPSIRIVGCHHGYFNKSGSENNAVINKINESGAQILFVCFAFHRLDKRL